jgi:adenosylhomocysteinase
VELNLKALETVTRSKRTIREFVVEHTLKGGKKIYVLAEGRLINLSAAEGHPSSVMDMSFANQALSAEHLVKKGKRLENKVYPVPAAIDEMIAKLKLKAMGVKIDTLTKEQKEYLSSWEAGT